MCVFDGKELGGTKTNKYGRYLREQQAVSQMDANDNIIQNKNIHNSLSEEKIH